MGYIQRSLVTLTLLAGSACLFYQSVMQTPAQPVSEYNIPRIQQNSSDSYHVRLLHDQGPIGDNGRKALESLVALAENNNPSSIPESRYSQASYHLLNLVEFSKRIPHHPEYNKDFPSTKFQENSMEVKLHQLEKTLKQFDRLEREHVRQKVGMNLTASQTSYGTMPWETSGTVENGLIVVSPATGAFLSEQYGLMARIIEDVLNENVVVNAYPFAAPKSEEPVESDTKWPELAGGLLLLAANGFINVKWKKWNESEEKMQEPEKEKNY